MQCSVALGILCHKIYNRVLLHYLCSGNPRLTARNRQLVVALRVDVHLGVADLVGSGGVVDVEGLVKIGVTVKRRDEASLLQGTLSQKREC